MTGYDGLTWGQYVVRVVLLAAVVLVLALVIAEWRFLVIHLSQETGTSSSNSRAYDFWSGFGSDIGEATLIVAVAGAWRHVNCHTPRCWRLGKHPAADGIYKLCRHHHPELAGKGRPTLESIHAHHRRLKEERTQ